MKMDGNTAHQHLLTTIDRFVIAATKEFGKRLTTVIQYGSTVYPPLKRATDIDLLMVVDSLPAKIGKRLEAALRLEESVAKDLEFLRSNGFHLDFSPVLKTPEEARRFWLPYLDMVSTSRVVYDPHGMGQKILDAVAEWIKQSGARKIQRGLTTYWDLKPDYQPDETFDLDFEA